MLFSDFIHKPSYIVVTGWTRKKNKEQKDTVNNNLNEVME